MGFLGGNRQTTDQTVTNEPSQFIRPFLSNLFQLGQQASANINRAPFSGDTFAGPTGAQLLGQNMAIRQAQGAGDLGAASDAGIGRLHFRLAQDQLANAPQLGAFQNFNLDPGGNRLQGAISAAVAPITRNFTDNIAPSFRSSLVNNGAFGGARSQISGANLFEQAVSRPAQEVAQQLALRDFQDVRSQGLQQSLASNQFRLGNADQQRRLRPLLLDNELRVAQSLPAIERGNFQLGLQPSQVFSQVGGEQQRFNQGFLDEALRNFQLQNQIPFTGLDSLSNIIQGQPFINQNTTQTGPRTGGGVAGGIQGAVGGVSGANALANLGLFTANPITLGIGGVLGALGGLF